LSQAFEWTDVEVAYMAGIFDALVDVNLTSAKQRGETVIRFKCVLSSTSKDLCRWAAERFDGQFEDEEPNSRGRYSCRWASGPALLLITRLIPHLYVKQKQAELLVKFLNLAWKERKVDVAKRKLAMGLVQELTKLQPIPLLALSAPKVDAEPEVIFVGTARPAKR